MRDTGVGMSPDMLRRAFDLFVQGDVTLARSPGGIGVGLTLVRTIVELHGGEVAAFSEGLGRGSEFVVCLPLAPAPEPMPANDALPNPTLTPTPALHVLLVEDDPDLRSSLRAILEFDGIRVTEAADGPAALAAAGRELPAAALVDIGLPGLDGYAVARELRRQYPATQLRLIALTGYARPGDREEALAAGFDLHLPKPINPRDLARVLTIGPAA